MHRFALLKWHYDKSFVDWRVDELVKRRVFWEYLKTLCGIYYVELWLTFWSAPSNWLMSRVFFFIVISPLKVHTKKWRPAIFDIQFAPEENNWNAQARWRNDSLYWHTLFLLDLLVIINQKCHKGREVFFRQKDIYALHRDFYSSLEWALQHYQMISIEGNASNQLKQQLISLQ